MAGLITILHVLICVLIIIAILMQSGKGGGLTEGFSATENLLGAQTNAVMLKITTALAVLFLITCLTLAVLNSRKERSLMSMMPDKGRTTTVDVDKLFDQAPSQTITINAAEPTVNTVP